MHRNHNSFEFVEYLKDAISDLITPIEEVLWSIWESGDDIPDGLGTIRGSLWACGLYYANVDGKFSESEVGFILDVYEALGAEIDESTSNAVYLQVYSNTYENRPELFKFGVPPFVGLLQHYDLNNGTDYATSGKNIVFRYVNTLTKADGDVSKNEIIIIQKLKELLFGTEQGGGKLVEKNEPDSVAKNPPKEKNTIELVDELNDYIGLHKVKQDVQQMVNFLKVQQMRAEKGMDAQPVSRHLVFYGNPGTGKTTIARLIAKIYKSLGILSKGHLIETDRSGLVAGYVGQTALKVKEVVSQAIGGVLFIDEAYSLNKSDGSDYGKEAIDTLIKLMEDNRNDLVVIVAGYTDKMQDFLSTNPGLRSRFNKFFEFHDYSTDELISIFGGFCKNGGYNTSNDTITKLTDLFYQLSSNKNSQFGNGRLARNIYEMTINKQANRIVLMTDIDNNILSEITEDDVPNIDEINQQFL